LNKIIPGCYIEPTKRILSINLFNLITGQNMPNKTLYLVDGSPYLFRVFSPDLNRMKNKVMIIWRWYSMPMVKFSHDMYAML